MAGEELQVIRLRNDFYRDGFKKMMFALSILLTAVILLIATSIYLFVNKPQPITFATDDDWRILPPVSVEKPYLSDANLLQWVSETFSTIFNFDFLTYENKHEANQLYFTENGLKKYNDFLNSNLPNSAVQVSKAVVTGVANGGPSIQNQGILPAKKYAWIVRMPVKIDFVGYNRSFSQVFLFQAMVVRVPTLDNLSGVAIDDFTIISQKQNTTGMLSR